MPKVLYINEEFINFDFLFCPHCGWWGIVDDLKSGFTFPKFCPSCGTPHLNQRYSGGENLVIKSTREECKC